MTLVGPGTWEAARGGRRRGRGGGVDRVGGHSAVGRPPGRLRALCRPPGHHVTHAYGRSCYLNNAAVAAQGLRSRRRTGRRPDLDAHHGNGTQAIFYGRGDVFYGSVHVDPGAGWFPHYAGFAGRPAAGRRRVHS
jgi:acetoin utilization deacetylase AcuC-like enzyme